MKQGDLVVRKSYGGDIMFRIAVVAGQGALLRGTDYRLLADAPLTDLETVRNPDELGGPRKARIHATESLVASCGCASAKSCCRVPTRDRRSGVSHISRCRAKCSIWTGTPITCAKACRFTDSCKCPQKVFIAMNRKCPIC